MSPKPPPPPRVVAEQVVDVEAAAAAAAERRRRSRRRKPPRRSSDADLVVLRALLGVADDVVGLGDRLELLVLRGVTGVGVGVVGARELAVGLLDLVGARRPCLRRARGRSPFRPSRRGSIVQLMRSTSLSAQLVVTAARTRSGRRPGRRPGPARPGPPGRRSGSPPWRSPCRWSPRPRGPRRCGRAPRGWSGRTRRPAHRTGSGPAPATIRSSWSATALKPSSSAPCSRARSMVSSTSMIGASAWYVAFSRISSRSRSTRRL